MIRRQKTTAVCKSASFSYPFFSRSQDKQTDLIVILVFAAMNNRAKGYKFAAQTPQNGASKRPWCKVLRRINPLGKVVRKRSEEA